MSKVKINDLAASKKISKKEMRKTKGGMRVGTATPEQGIFERPPEALGTRPGSKKIS